MAVFAFSKILWLSMLCLALTGMGAILVFASNNTLVQNLVEEGKRGRTMSIYTVAFLGGMPLGGLLTGALADAAGVTLATSLNAFFCLTLTLVFAALLPRLRRDARPCLSAPECCQPGIRRFRQRQTAIHRAHAELP